MYTVAKCVRANSLAGIVLGVLVLCICVAVRKAVWGWDEEWRRSKAANGICTSGKDTVDYVEMLVVCSNAVILIFPKSTETGIVVQMIISQTIRPSTKT